VFHSTATDIARFLGASTSCPKLIVDGELTSDQLKALG
jgi:hypothetical protein